MLLRSLGFILAIVGLIIGVPVMLWGALDGSYTGLFGVQNSVGAGGRVALVLFGFVLCLPFIGTVVAGWLNAQSTERMPTDFAAHRKGYVSEPPQPVHPAVLSDWEKELIEKAKRKKQGNPKRDAP